MILKDRTWLWVVVAVLLAAGRVHATINVVISPSNGGTWQIETGDFGEFLGVRLVRDASVSGTVDFLVTGGSTEQLRAITVRTNNATDLTTIHIRGASPATNTGSVYSILKTGTGPVTLSELRLAGNLGIFGITSEIVGVEEIDLFVVNGQVYGSVRAVNDSFAPGSAVGGGFHGNLTVSDGSIISLIVTEDFAPTFGEFDNRHVIDVGGNIVNLVAEGFTNLYIDVEGAIDTLQAPYSAYSVLYNVDINAQTVKSGQWRRIRWTLLPTAVPKQPTHYWRRIITCGV